MGRTVECEYSLTVEQAEALRDVVAVPVTDLRKNLLRRYARKHGTAGLVELFAEFVGLARSVEANAADAIAVLGWVSGDTHPESSQGANLPTLLGACRGVLLDAATCDVIGRCDSCAFRLGTWANQSPLTTDDAAYCESGQFKCHEDMDEHGEPTRPCAGNAAFQAALRRGSST